MNWLQWGSFIESPRLDQAHLLANPLHVGLFGFLLSPGCSIFLYSPLLLLLPSTSRVFWTRHRDECAAFAAVSLCLLLLCSSFVQWTGLWSSPGPRYLFLLTPLLMLALGPWLDTRPGPRAGLVVAVLALAGGVVQILLMSARWSAVIALMDYKPFAPMMDFVFLPDRSPIEGSWLALQAGHVDAWLHGVWYGWPGKPGAPAVAAVLLSLWIVSVVVSARSLRRSLAAAR
jgi:hypothetical protein